MDKMNNFVTDISNNHINMPPNGDINNKMQQ